MALRSLVIKGAARPCIVPAGEVQAVITRLRRLSDTLDDADSTANFLESSLMGSPKWRDVAFQEPQTKALLHVLDLMLNEGSLSEALYCVRRTLLSR